MKTSLSHHHCGLRDARSTLPVACCCRVVALVAVRLFGSVLLFSFLLVTLACLTPKSNQSSRIPQDLSVFHRTRIKISRIHIFGVLQTTSYEYYLWFVVLPSSSDVVLMFCDDVTMMLLD
jgi:hypothetical protein